MTQQQILIYFMIHKTYELGFVRFIVGSLWFVMLSQEGAEQTINIMILGKATKLC